MQLSAQGRTFIKNLEGLRLTAYPDAKGYSIGYGHFGAQKGDVITRAQAEALFNQDVSKYAGAVNETVPRATQQQFDAMVALCWNVGVAGFARSKMAKLHNQGNYAGAADAFRMWRLSDGVENPVLVRRREKERDVYLYNRFPVPGAQPLPIELAAGPSPVLWGLGAALAAYVLLPRLGPTRRMLALRAA